MKGAAVLDAPVPQVLAPGQLIDLGRVVDLGPRRQRRPRRHAGKGVAAADRGDKNDENDQERLHKRACFPASFIAAVEGTAASRGAGTDSG